MKTKTLRAPDEISSLERPWEELAQTCAPHTLVNGPVWLGKWFAHFSDEFTPMIITVWESGLLSGVAPLAIHKRFIGTRVLTLAGAPHAAPCDFPSAGSVNGQTAAEIVNEILANRKEWDLCDIADISPDSYLLKAVSERSSEFIFGEVKTVDEPFFSLDLQACSLAGKSSRKHKYNLNRARKKLSADAPVEFKVVARAEELEAYLPQVFEIHRRRWNGYYTGSLMSSGQGKAFLREVAAAYLERGSLYLALLAVAGSSIAYALCFFFNNTLYYYNPAFDPQFAALSPGSLLLEDIVRDCRQRGISRIEFGKGRLQYKERMATSSVAPRRMILAKRSATTPFILRSYLMFLSAREAARKSELVRKVAGRMRRTRV